jgi:deazaflavin-dependent oxidoreductase (nitroreductase family)
VTTEHGFADPTVSLDLLERIEAGEAHPPKPDFLDDNEWSMIVDSRDRTVVRSAGVGHAEAYQAVGGEGLDETQGGPVLVLTTVGRKTGNDVRTCVNFVRDGDAFYVVGSFAGFGGDPHWSRNLDANPVATVQVRDEVTRVRAERVSGDDRVALWPMLTGHFPLWGHFQRYCRREFALWRLTPQP